MFTKCLLYGSVSNGVCIHSTVRLKSVRPQNPQFFIYFLSVAVNMEFGTVHWAFRVTSRIYFCKGGRNKLLLIIVYHSTWGHHTDEATCDWHHILFPCRSKIAGEKKKGTGRGTCNIAAPSGGSGAAACHPTTTAAQAATTCAAALSGSAGKWLRPKLVYHGLHACRSRIRTFETELAAWDYLGTSSDGTIHNAKPWIKFSPRGILPAFRATIFVKFCNGTCNTEHFPVQVNTPYRAE